jgi:hypothetical protein
MQRKSLSDILVLAAIKNTEFGEEIIRSQPKVAVIMTQDWCLEWKRMAGWLDVLDDLRDADIYEFIYNRSEYFHDFRKLKENKWKNDLIPYIRYYVDGLLVNESNYVIQEKFLRMLGI